MAKKKSAKPPRVTQPSSRERKAVQESQVTPVLGDDADKVFVQVRMDSRLHAKLKNVAERAGISLNQLMNGLCGACAERLQVGRASKRSDGFVAVEPDRGCVYVGEPGEGPSEEAREYYEETGEKPPIKNRGVVWFGLDYSGRGIVSFPQ